jgi:hypothetical protein
MSLRLRQRFGPTPRIARTLAEVSLAPQSISNSTAARRTGGNLRGRRLNAGTASRMGVRRGKMFWSVTRMPDLVPPSRPALIEALELSAEILKNLELSEISLSNIALKTARLARLLNDSTYQTIMEYEAGGYPSESDGVPADIFELAVLAGRKTEDLNPTTKQPEQQVYLESISSMEERIRITDKALLAATDPDDSSEPQGSGLKETLLNAEVFTARTCQRRVGWRKVEHLSIDMYYSSIMN